MKKILYKLKVFLGKLKFVFLEAWNGLKTALKQSQEKSQEKENKPIKGTSKVLNTVVVILSVILVSFSLKQCSTSTSAKAFPITGNYLLSTPCVTVAQIASNGVLYDNVTIPNFYISLNNDENGIPYVNRFYYIGGSSGDLGYNSVDISSGYSSLSSIPLLVGDSTTPNNLLWSQIPIDISITDNSWLPIDFLSQIVVVRQGFLPSSAPYGGYSGLVYDYLAYNKEIILTLTIDFNYSVVDGSPLGFVFPRYYNDDSDRPLEYYSTNFVSYSYRPPITNDNEYYYNVGYYDGYNLGLEAGLDDNFSVFDSIFSAVDSFLDIELFDGFKISTLLYIGFGLLLVGFVIKVFLGG